MRRTWIRIKKPPNRLLLEGWVKLSTNPLNVTKYEVSAILVSIWTWDQIRDQCRMEPYVDSHNRRRTQLSNTCDRIILLRVSSCFIIFFNDFLYRSSHLIHTNSCVLTTFWSFAKCEQANSFPQKIPAFRFSLLSLRVFLILKRENSSRADNVFGPPYPTRSPSTMQLFWTLQKLPSA